MAGKIIKLLLALGLLILFSAFSGCLDEENKEIKRFYGTWVETNQIEETTHIYYKNGSLYTNYINHDTGDVHKGWGNFELISGQLHLFTDHGHDGQNESYIYDYEFLENDTQLILTFGVIVTILEKV